MIRVSRRDLWRAALLAGALVLVWLGVALAWNPVQVTWSQHLSKPGDRVQLFYAYQPGQFRVEQSVTRNAAAHRWLDYEVRLHSLRRIREVRIDPSQLDDHRLVMGEVTLRTRWGERSWRGQDLQAAMTGWYDYRLVHGDADRLVMHSLGNDPHFSLPLDRWLVYPHPWQLAGQGALVFGLGFALGLLLARIDGQRWRDLPPRLITRRSGQMMAVVGLAAVLALGASWVRVAETTPFFQGPDEGAHVANAFYGFNRLGLGREDDCGDVWVALNAVKAEFDYMVRRFTLPLLPEQMAELERIRDSHSWQATGDQLEGGLHTSCHNFDLINGGAYGALSVPAFQLGAADTVVDFLRLTRFGQMLVAAGLVGLLFWMIARGRSLLADVVPHDTATLRWVALLATVFYLAMPQNLFMSSVINREAYMVPLGIGMLLAFFFWHRWVTPLVLLLGLYAFWPARMVYWLIPLLWLLWMGLLMAHRRRPRLSRFALPGVLTLVGYVLGPMALLGMGALAMQDHLPRMLPENLAVEEDFWHFHHQVLVFIQRVWSLEILEWRSFFGFLGSLDTPLSPLAKTAWQAIFASLPLVFVAGLLINRPVAWRELARFWLMVLAFAVPMAFTVGVITYGGYQVYVLDGLAAWGTQVQGRYFLPVYFYIFLVYGLLAASPFIIGWGSALPVPDHAERARGWLVLGLMVAVATAFWISVGVTLDGLEQRYFVSPADVAAYRAIFWQ